jgi:hypothetical protein
MGFGVWGLAVWGLGFGVWGLGFRVGGLGLGFGVGVRGSGFGVRGLGFGVQGWGFVGRKRRKVGFFELAEPIRGRIEYKNWYE